MLSALRRIQSRSRATAQKFATHVPASTEIPCPFSVSDLVLPTPEPLTTQLVALGIDEPSAQRISSIMMQTVLCLKQRCESDFKRRREVLQAQAHYFQDPKSKSLVPATYLVIYSQAIRYYTKYLLEEFTPRVLKARALQEECRPLYSTSRPRRRPFNQSSLPILEGFFDGNAFPSRVEKYELAHKCEMDYRQIHVWFQNRRSRFRKEGKELRKRSSVLREALEKSIEDALLPLEEDDVRWTSEAALSPLAEKQRTSAFDLDQFDVPPHAYPTPYPPPCSYEPFSDTRKFDTPWLRMASTPTRPLLEPSSTVSELVLSFSKLSIDGESPSSMHDSHSGSSRFDCGLGFVTHCPHAPLPALVRLPQRALRITRRADRVSSLTQFHGRERGQRSPCRNTTSTTSCDVRSPIKPSGSPSCRPKASLPRRIPKNPPLNHSSAGATSPVFLRLPALSPSRETSVGSVVSESLPCSSDSESPLSTPSILPTHLPAIPLTQSSCSTVTFQSSPISCYAPTGEPSSLLDFLRQDFASALFQDTDQGFVGFSSIPMLHSVC